MSSNPPAIPTQDESSLRKLMQGPGLQEGLGLLGMLVLVILVMSILSPYFFRTHSRVLEVEMTVQKGFLENIDVMESVDE